MSAASDSLTPVVLELGGKDAFVILDDADLDHVSHPSLKPASPYCRPAAMVTLFLQWCSQRSVLHEPMWSTVEISHAACMK